MSLRRPLGKEQGPTATLASAGNRIKLKRSVFTSKQRAAVSGPRTSWGRLGRARTESRSDKRTFHTLADTHPSAATWGCARQLQLPGPQLVLHHPENFSVPLDPGLDRWGPLGNLFHWTRREALPNWKVKALKSLGDAHKREGQRAAQSLRSKNKGKPRP